VGGVACGSVHRALPHPGRVAPGMTMAETDLFDDDGRFANATLPVAA
jgi:hypothetical protein